ILPEKFLDGLRTLLREVFMHQAQRLTECAHGFAISPVTREEQPVRTESIPDFIQPRTIKAELARDSSARSHPAALLIDALKDLGDLYIHLLAFSEFAKSLLVSSAGRRFVGDRRARQVVNHNPEARNLVGDSQQIRDI